MKTSSVFKKLIASARNSDRLINSKSRQGFWQRYSYTAIFLTASLISLHLGIQPPSWAEESCSLGSLPVHAGNYKTRGSKLLSEAKYREALTCFDKANAINPSDPEVWNGRGVALAKLKDYQAAIASYDRAIQIPPGVLALNSTERRIQANDYYLWWFNRGTALADLGRHEDALESYNKAIQLQPIFEPAWYFKGITLDRLKRPFQEAIAAYDISNQIHIAKVSTPKDLEYVHLEWYRRGIALTETKQYEEAIVAFDKAIQVKPDSFPLWYFRGKALNALGKYEEAVKSYETSIELAPDFSQAWQEKGEALISAQKYSDAISSFDKAIAIDKFWENQQSAANAWYGRGLALYNSSRYGEAIASLDRAIALQPNFELALDLRQQAQIKIRAK